MLPEHGTTHILRRILTGPQFPDLQNRRRDRSLELMASEIPPSSDVMIFIFFFKCDFKQFTEVYVPCGSAATLYKTDLTGLVCSRRCTAYIFYI